MQQNLRTNELFHYQLSRAEEYSGIIFLRLQKQDNPSVMRALIQPMQFLEKNDIHGKLWVVTESEIRIRSAE